MIIPFFAIKWDLLFYDLLMFNHVFFNGFMKFHAVYGFEAFFEGIMG
jgi:hypothetical protein